MKKPLVITGAVLWLAACAYVVHTCRQEPATGNTATQQATPARPATPPPVLTPTRHTLLDDDTGLFLPKHADPNAPPPGPSMLGTDGKLTFQALEAAGISRDEMKGLQDAIDTAWERMSDLVRQNTEPDPLRSNGITTAYRIKAFAAEGREVRASLRNAFIEQVGQPRADSLLANFHWSGYFGAFGRCEVLVQFRDLDPGEDNLAFIRAEWKDREPESGRVVAATQANYDEFKRHFGASFVVEKPKDDK